LHINLQLLSSAGLFLIIVFGAPGAHGAEVTGMHGIGVNTPNAAAVAAATCGLLGVLHMANGMMFFMGTLSIIVAAAILLALTVFSGVTTMLLGAAPKLHCNIAPITTC
jgi:hypothetical protein